MNTNAAVKNRNELVYQTLKNDIMTLRLKPGQVLSEAEICERFSVSRTPARDALRLLQEQGFVKFLPYKGVTVTLLNYSKIRQIVYMRFTLEAQVIRDFMQIKTPLLMEEINHLIRKQEVIIDEPDFLPEQFIPLDLATHAVWFKATQMEYVWDLLQTEDLHYRRFRTLDIATETNFPRIINDHRQIFEQIALGNPDKMEEYLRPHLYFALNRTQDIIHGQFKDYFE